MWLWKGKSMCSAKWKSFFTHEVLLMGNDSLDQWTLSIFSSSVRILGNFNYLLFVISKVVLRTRFVAGNVRST